MTRSIMLAAALCAALATSARAGGDADAAAIQAVLDAQAKAIAAGDPAPFVATVAPDVYLMLPGAYATCRAQAAEAVGVAWPKPGHGAITAKVGKTVIGHDGALAWVTATIDFRVGKDAVAFRFTELLSRDGTAWKARAIMASRAIKDVPSDWDNMDVGGLSETTPAHASFDEPPTPATDWLKSPAVLGAHLRAGNDVVVLGSAPGEQGAGAAAGKLLAGWKKLRFDVDAANGGDGKTFAWVAAFLGRTVPSKSKEWGPTTMEPYWAMVLLVKGAKDWEVVSAHFSQDAPSALGLHGTPPPADCD